jgi:hypothetical protein
MWSFVSSPIIINTSPIEEQHHHKPNETDQPNEVEQAKRVSN